MASYRQKRSFMTSLAARFETAGESCVVEALAPPKRQTGAASSIPVKTRPWPESHPCETGTRRMGPPEMAI